MKQKTLRINKQNTGARAEIRPAGLHIHSDSARQSTASFYETTGTVQSSPVALRSRFNNASSTKGKAFFAGAAAAQNVQSPPKVQMNIKPAAVIISRKNANLQENGSGLRKLHTSQGTTGRKNSYVTAKQQATLREMDLFGQFQQTNDQPRNVQTEMISQRSAYSYRKAVDQQQFPPMSSTKPTTANTRIQKVAQDLLSIKMPMRDELDLSSFRQQTTAMPSKISKRPEDYRQFKVVSNKYGQFQGGVSMSTLKAPPYSTVTSGIDLNDNKNPFISPDASDARLAGNSQMDVKRCGYDYRLPTPTTRKYELTQERRQHAQQLMMQQAIKNKNSMLIKGSVTTAPDIIHNGEEFVFGGWTYPQTPKGRQNAAAANSNIDELIPNLGTSLLYKQNGPASVRHNKEMQDGNFRSMFSSKGLESELARDDYSQSLGQDRGQAKSFMISRLQGQRNSEVPNTQTRNFFGKRNKSYDQTSNNRSYYKGGRDRRIDMIPEELQEEFTDLHNKRISGRHQRRAMFGTAKMSEYRDSQEKKEDEFPFDFKEMLKNLEQRQEEQKNADLQADQLRDQLVQKHNQKHSKRHHLPLTTENSGSNLTAKKQRPRNNKKQKPFMSRHNRMKAARGANEKPVTPNTRTEVRFNEDQKAMLKRLKNQSTRLNQRRMTVSLLNQVGPYFETEMYEEAGVAQDSKDNDSENSSNSYRSGRLYSEHESEDSEENADKIAALKRENTKKFMKMVEKQMMYGQGYRGFNSLLQQNNEADNEKTRHNVMSKLIFDKMQQEHGEQIKLLFEQQEQMDRDATPTPDMNPDASIKGSVRDEMSPLGRRSPNRRVNTDNEDLQQKVMNPYIEVGDYNLEEEKKRQKWFQDQELAQKKAEGNDEFFEQLKVEIHEEFNDHRQNGSFMDSEHPSSDESEEEKKVFKLGVQMQNIQKQPNNTKRSTCIDRQPPKQKRIRSLADEVQKNKNNDEQRKMKQDEHLTENTMKSLNKIVKQVKFKEIMMKQNSGQVSGLDETPAFIFQQECEKSSDLMLPILNKIQNDSIILQDYFMQEGQINGLAEAILQTGQPRVRQIFLDNNQVNGTQLARLLAAMVQQKRLQEFVYKRNVFCDQSLAAITPIITSPPPHILIELRLVDCATSTKVMQDLHKTLANTETYLRSLALVQMKMNFPLTNLATFVENSNSLENLDLSGNDLQSFHFVNLLKAIAHNKTLHNINLSWNKILDENVQSSSRDADSAYNFPTVSINELVENGETNLYIHRESLDKIKANEIPQLVIESFNNLIRYNRNIQGINLDSTGLTVHVLAGFVPGLRHAKSLICFHLAQNPGVNPAVKEFYRQRLKIAAKENQILIDINRDRDDLYKPLTKEQRQNMTQNDKLIRDYKVKNFKRWLLDEAAKIQNNRQMNKVINKQEINNVLTVNQDDLTISRILGHKSIMPGAAQWQFNKKLDNSACWHCGNWILTCIFWNQEIGIFNANNNINIESAEKKRVIDTIRKHDKQYKSNEDVPMLFSNTTNWKGKPFMRLQDFLLKCTDNPKFYKQAYAIAKETLQFLDLDTLRSDEQERAKQFIEEKEKELHSEFNQSLFKNFKPEEQARQFLRYGEPLYINKEKITDPDNTFVLPIFVKPGRTHFMLRTPIDRRIQAKVANGGRVRILNYQNEDDVQFRFYYNRHIVPMRVEKVSGFRKQLKLRDINLNFIRSKSVFADWREDNSDTVMKCLQHDFEQWKVNKFVKDSKDLLAIKSFFEDNFALIKEIRVGSIAESLDPPDMNIKQFRKLMKLANIKDKHATSSILDGLFNAVNYDEMKNESNDARQLIRYEFFELLVRIAKLKYTTKKNSTEEISNARALHRLFNEHFLPILIQKKLAQWHPFRVKKLWNNEVSDLFKANKEQLHIVYNHILDISKVSIPQKYTIPQVSSMHLISIDQLLYYFETHNVCRIDPKAQKASKRDKYLVGSIHLNDKIVRVALYMSKQTIADELRDGPLEYSHLKFVEFLEFIGRIAYVYFEKTPHHIEWHLSQKIEVVLQQLFRPLSLSINRPVDRDAFISDSDEDY